MSTPSRFTKLMKIWYRWFPFFELFQYAQSVRWKIWANVLLIFTASCTLMLSAKLLGTLADALGQGSDLDSVTWLIVGIVGCEALHIFLGYRGRLGLARATNEVTHAIRLRLFGKIARLPMGYFDRTSIGATITRLTNDVEGLEAFFSGSLAKILSSGISIINVLIAMLITVPRFGGLVVLLALPAIFVGFGARKPIMFWMREYKSRSSLLNSRFAEFLRAFKLIKSSGLETWSGRLFDRGSSELRYSGIRLMTWNSCVRPATALLCSFPMIAILWWGGHQVLLGTLSLGVVVSYVRYAERFLNPIMVISQEINVIQESYTSSERLHQILDEQEEEEILGKNGTFVERIEGDVEFSHLSMHYYKHQPVLQDVSFRVQKGMRIGLVGRTGSGKSTTVALISSLYPFDQGEIKIDGVSLKSWCRESIRRQVGYVGQEVPVFPGTLRDNLLIVAENPADYDDAAILRVARRTGLDEVIERLPDGLNEELVDHGENLSSGERQLLAMTRVLLRDPRILILDEVTSQLDHQVELKVHRAMEEAFKGRTCFVIAHRLQTIRECDRILVFDHGKIVENGTHDELLARNGRYSDYLKQQAEILV